MLMIVELADVCFSRVNSRWAALPDSACRCTLPLPSPPPWRTQQPPSTLNKAAWRPWTAPSATLLQTSPPLLPPLRWSLFHRWLLLPWRMQVSASHAA